jgi:tRNA(Ile)-lysidine synthase
MYCAEAQSLLQEYAMILYQQVQGSQAQTLSVSKLLALDRAQQKLILRQWIEDSGYLLPNAKKLDTILHSVLAAQQDRMPRVSWATVNLRRYRDDLYLTPALPAIDKHLQVSWDLSQPITLPSIGQLSAALGMGQRLRADISSVIVRLRKGGESIIVPGRGRHTLKHLWQEWGVPPWQRERIPLLFSNEQLIAVVGRCIDENYLARANELGWQITYDPFI